MNDSPPSSVLYIDDESSLLDLGRLYLERIGHVTVDTEIDPEIGLRRVINGSYDAVISDYQMPGMDGIELLKAIRAAGCLIPFIIFTGKGREDVVIEALNEGADFYLQKGGDPKSQFAELAKKLDHAISRRRAEDGLKKKNEELAAAEEELRGKLEELITTEDALRKSRDLFQIFMDHSCDAVFIHDLEGRILHVNETTLRLYRINRNEALNYTIQDYAGSLSDFNDIQERWRSVIQGEDLIFTWQARRPTDGSVFDVEIFLTRVEVNGGVHILAYVRDITERKRAEKEILLNQQRLSTLFELTQMNDLPEHIINEFAIERGIGITESRVGYLAFVNEDEDILTMYSWSRSAMDECEIIDKPIRYPVKDTGLWGEAIRQRKAIITNDYAAETTLKKGYPEGHVPIKRHMNVPIVDDNKIVIVAGVGNKEEPYTDEDIRQLSLLMDGLWKILKNRRAGSLLQKKDEDLSAAEEKIRTLSAELATVQKMKKTDHAEQNRVLDDNLTRNNNAATLIDALPDPTIIVNKEGFVTAWNHAMEDLTGIPASDILGRGDFAYAVPLYGEKRSILVDQILGGEINPGDYINLRQEDGIIEGEAEINLPKRSRTVIWARAAPLLDETGECIGAIETIRDISALRKEQVKIRENTEKYRTIVENLDDIIFTLDTEGKITYLSPNVQKVIGLSVYEAKGKHLTDFVSPVVKEEVLYFLNKILSEEEIVTEFPVKNHLGRDLWMRLNARPVKDGDTIISIHGLLTDITEKKRAQEALIESKENYRALVENLTEIIYTLDCKAIITYITPNIEKLGGYTAEEAIGKVFTEFVHPDDRKGRSKEFLRILEGSGEVTEYRFLAKDGHTVWMRTAARPMIKKGKVVGIQGILTDITNLKTAEKEIRLYLKRTRTLLDLYQKSEGSDRDIMEYALEGIKEITGSEYSVIGFLNDDESALTIQAGSEEVMDACRMPRPPGEFRIDQTGLLCEVVRTRRSVIINDYDANNPTKRGCLEGHIRIERFLMVPIFNGGRISAILAVANKYDPYTEDDADALITLGNLAFGILDRKQTELALRESEERFRRLAENAGDIIYKIDLLPQPHFVYVNPAIETITGYSPEEFYADPELGRQVIHPDDQLPDLKTDSIQRIYPVIRYIRKDGEIIWVEQRNVPIYDDKGEVVAVEGIARDITAAKEAEEGLARSAAAIADANRKLNLMTGITRHDIANQLTVLNGYLSLAEDITDESTLSGYLEKINLAAERIQRQIAFTGEYQNLGEAAPDWQMLSYVIEQIGATRIPIVNETHEISVFADPLLPKVFANLMENTERYAVGVTRIRVSCQIEKMDDHTFRDPEGNTRPILIIWEDDGVGIRDEEKEKIFERGYGKNTGLGLFFIREILGITGITITENGVYGEGARFVMRVPERGWWKEE